MSTEQKEEFLKSKGWFQWYSENYWCHKKVVKTPVQDCTNYGMSLEDAYKFEVEDMEPFKGQFLGHLGGLRW